ncbi:MAG: hypothetical protein ACRD43_12110, partial [Pyrinomonadaceae bacterium]
MLSIAVFTFAALATHAQVLPGKLRGYKVHRINIEASNSVSPSPKAEKPDVALALGEPTLLDISLSGITFSIPVTSS